MSRHQVNLEALRLRAERAIDRSQAGWNGRTETLKETDARQLVEELRIYQTELEIQNQELSSAQSEISLTLEKYRALFDNLPLPAIIADGKGFIVEANLQASELIGLHRNSQLQHRSVLQLFDIDSRSHLYPALGNRTDPKPRNVENLGLTIGSGETIPCDAHIIHLQEESQHEGRTLLVLVDQSTEVALRESEERYGALFMGAKAPMLMVDPESGDILEANAAAQSFYGYDHDQLRHMKISDINMLSPDSIKAEMKLAQAEKRHCFYFPHRLASGEVRQVEVYSGPITYGSKTVLYSIVHDITERRQAEGEVQLHRHHLEELVEERTAALVETEARASHILQSSADGLYGVDNDGVITFINPAACNMLGYAAEEVIGQSAHTLFHHSKPDGSPYHADECPGHRAVRGGVQVRVGDEVYWRKDSRAIPIMYAVHPMIQQGLNTGSVVSFVDMSEQRAAERAREKALAAAENLARVRSEFLANMSHEIRTPLNGVLGFAEIGFRNYQNSEKAQSAFAKIKASGTRLLGVINDILDFSKVEAGKLSIEKTEVSLTDVIDHAIELVGDRARAKRLDLRVKLAPDLPRTCISDSLRLGQVLLNLLSNAIKFTESGSVTLSASREGDELVFKVTDTGIGIDEQHLGQLFNPFQQADGSTTRKFGGTGLGLAISKRILELMEGDIRAESHPGVGSTFEFRLPYIESAAPSSERKPVEVAAYKRLDKPLAGLSILAAEDDVINQMVLEENLIHDGAMVVLVGNGREAVERVIRDGSAAYDIVLMDIQMPEMDGYEATRRICALAPDLPIIGQTAHALEEEREKCLAAGMVGHIAKPIDPELLVKMVREHVAKAVRIGDLKPKS
jgi:PAS domain S-box-containing protein